MKINCPNCKYPNFSDAGTCRKCGKKLPRTCPECGTAVADEATFCSKCGAIFDKDKVDPKNYLFGDLSHGAWKKKDTFKPHIHSMIECPECGEVVSSEALFCSHCGHIFKKGASEMVRMGAAEQEAMEKGERPLLLEDLAHIETAVPPVQIEPEPPAVEKIIELDMAVIPAGEFLKGAAAESAETGAFLMDCYPVTRKQYAEFVKATGHPAPPEWGGGSYPPELGDHPVVNVSFRDATVYAGWAGKRLPTNDEWEKAARGVSGLRYPWGNEFDSRAANTRESGFGGTTPVTRYEKYQSPFGCVDMMGNAAEWVQPEEGRYDFRGGSFKDGKEVLTAHTRFQCDSPDFRGPFLGFRCAKGQKK